MPHGGASLGDSAKKAVLRATDPHDHNIFEDPNRVRAEWSEIEGEADLSVIQIPAASVSLIET